MVNIEMVNDCVDTAKKANILIDTIQLHASLFESRVGFKPTVFMSYDLFAILVGATTDVIMARCDKHKTIHTVCDYDLELLHSGSKLLYLGYSINMKESICNGLEC